MTRLFTLCITMFGLVATCVAQKHPCRFSDSSDLGRADGVSVRRVTVIEKSETVAATVLIPDRSDPMPGIVFSHSAIHGSSNSTDLLRLAWALARAGAASIVLDGTIEWQWPNDDSIRPPEFQFCAGQWLMEHVNLDLTRTAEAGNHRIGWIENDVSHCGLEMSGEAQCWPGGMWLDFGQIGDAESRNTGDMLTIPGQMQMAQFAQKQLRLKEINPDWLTKTAEPLSRVNNTTTNRGRE
jgi:hypothetical protein